MNVNFPYQFDGRGRHADPIADYVRQLVEQVLFTSPGERVNLPDFGSGLLQMTSRQTAWRWLRQRSLPCRPHRRNGSAGT